MSKTLYSNGNTGITAIMEGDFSQSVIDNPQANADKLYFHSGLQYIRKLQNFSGSLTYSAVPQGKYFSSNDTIGSFTVESSDIFMLNPTVNGVESQGHFLIQSRIDNTYIRYVGFYYYLTSNTLTIMANATGYNLLSAGMPAITISYSIDVYGIATIVQSGFYVTPSMAKFGRFSAENTYLKIVNTSDGYRLIQDNPYTFTGINGAPTFSPASTTAIGVSE